VVFLGLFVFKLSAGVRQTERLQSVTGPYNNTIMNSMQLLR